MFGLIRFTCSKDHDKSYLLVGWKKIVQIIIALFMNQCFRCDFPKKNYFRWVRALTSSVSSQSYTDSLQTINLVLHGEN